MRGIPQECRAEGNVGRVLGDDSVSVNERDGLTRSSSWGMVSTPLEGADIDPPSPQRVVSERGRVILGPRMERAQGAHEVENPGGDRHRRP